MFRSNSMLRAARKLKGWIKLSAGRIGTLYTNTSYHAAHQRYKHPKGRCRACTMSSALTTTSTTQAAPTYVETTVNYFPKEGGTMTYTPGSAAFYKRKFTPTTVRVQDIRGSEAEFSLDKQGFQFVRHHSEQGDFSDEAHIKEFYFAETEKLIQRA